MMSGLIEAITAAGTTTTSVVTITGSTLEIVLRLAIGLGLGLIISVAYMVCNRRTYSRNFAISMVILPALVAAIIWLIGSDLTVAISLGGVFALVRFRSVPGDSKDITCILATMAAGLAVGLGVYSAAAIIVVAAVIIYVVLTLTPFASRGEEQQLRITVPESLNYEGVFDEILSEYSTGYDLEMVKTSRMGTMFDLTYRITLKKDADTKKMIDALRVKNGNLDIVLNMVPKVPESKTL